MSWTLALCKSGLCSAGVRRLWLWCTISRLSPARLVRLSCVSPHVSLSRVVASLCRLSGFVLPLASCPASRRENLTHGLDAYIPPLVGFSCASGVARGSLFSPAVGGCSPCRAWCARWSLCLVFPSSLLAVVGFSRRARTLSRFPAG